MLRRSSHAAMLVALGLGLSTAMLAPVASADVGGCEAFACAGTQHSESGACDGSASGPSSSETNGVYASVLFVYAKAGDFCSQNFMVFGSSRGYRGIEAAVGIQCGAFPCELARVEWIVFSSGSGSDCQVIVFAGPTGALAECPVGPPDHPFAVLP